MGVAGVFTATLLVSGCATPEPPTPPAILAYNAEQAKDWTGAIKHYHAAGDRAGIGRNMVRAGQYKEAFGFLSVGDYWRIVALIGDSDHHTAYREMQNVANLEQIAKSPVVDSAYRITDPVLSPVNINGRGLSTYYRALAQAVGDANGVTEIDRLAEVSSATSCPGNGAATHRCMAVQYENRRDTAEEAGLSRFAAVYGRLARKESDQESAATSKDVQDRQRAANTRQAAAEARDERIEDQRIQDELVDSFVRALAPLGRR